jgi:hypothetical protein
MLGKAAFQALEGGHSLSVRKMLHPSGAVCWASATAAPSVMALSNWQPDSTDGGFIVQRNLTTNEGHCRVGSGCATYITEDQSTEMPADEAGLNGIAPYILLAL